MPSSQVLGSLAGNAMHLRAIGVVLCCCFKARVLLLLFEPTTTSHVVVTGCGLQKDISFAPTGLTQKKCLSFANNVFVFPTCQAENQRKRKPASHFQVLIGAYFSLALTCQAWKWNTHHLRWRFRGLLLWTPLERVIKCMLQVWYAQAPADGLRCLPVWIAELVITVRLDHWHVLLFSNQTLTC